MRGRMAGLAPGRACSAALALALAFAAAHAAEPAADALVVYRGATLIDGTGAAPVPGRAIVVRGERIEAIVADEPGALPNAAETVDMRGRYVLPGLVNAHTHLATPPDRDFALAMMRRDLYGGVTAVRSMADDTRAMADLARAARQGEVAGPDIVFAALFAGPEFFQDERIVASAAGEKPGAIPWQRAVTRGTDLREAVTLARGTGASGIKIYADLSARDVARIAREAHRQGMKAWAHAAVFPASPLEVAGAGVDTMSHICMVAYQGQAMPRSYHDRAPVDETRFASGMPAEVLGAFERIKARGVIVDATNFVYETIERMRAELPEGHGPPTYCSAALADRLTAKAHEMGVEIAAGTDAFAVPDDPYPAVQRELERWVRASGFTPLAAIRGATLVGARALGKADEMGTIEAGKLANLVFVDRDPAADIANLRRVELVVKRGKRYPRSEYKHPEAAGDTGRSRSR